MAKINWNLDYNETSTIEIDGVTVQVKKRIPFEEKLKFCSNYADVSAIMKDGGVAFMNPYKDLPLFQLTLKYYTDIELFEDDNVGWIYDYNIKNNLFSKVHEVAGDDLDVTLEMAEKTAEAVIDEWKQSHNIQSALSDMFSDNRLEEMAHSPELNDELIDFLHSRKQEPEEKVVQLSEFAKKNLDE